MIFTTTELAHLAVLLDKAADAFGNHGCNDYPVPNTDENWAMVEQIGADNIGVDVKVWRKHRDYEPRPKGETIYLHDWLVMRFLADRARELVKA